MEEKVGERREMEKTYYNIICGYFVWQYKYMKPKQKGENEEKLETEGMGIVKEGGDGGYRDSERRGRRRVWG